MGPVDAGGLEHGERERQVHLPDAATTVLQFVNVKNRVVTNRSKSGTVKLGSSALCIGRTKLDQLKITIS